MGCIVSGNLYGKHANGDFTSNSSPIEFEPTHDGGKKTVVEKALSVRQCKVITDPVITSRYDIKDFIDTGAFSDVFTAIDKKTKYPYAVKYIELRSLKSQKVFHYESNVLNEIKKKSSLTHHENIIKLKEIITSKFSAYIVMELCTGGDLFERIQMKGNIDEVETVRIAKMILNAIDYLHSLGITHRDLKPENILFYKPGINSRIVITDFGFASCLEASDSVLNTYCGTLEYCSPELMSGKPYSNKADIWAIGVITYFMLAGYLPFVGKNILTYREEITSHTHSYQKQIWKTISEKAKNFIDKLLAKNESDRCSAKEALNHCWLAISPTHKVSHRRKNHSQHASCRDSTKLSSVTGLKRGKKNYQEFDNLSLTNSHGCGGDTKNLEKSIEDTTSLRTTKVPKKEILDDDFFEECHRQEHVRQFGIAHEALTNTFPVIEQNGSIIVSQTQSDHYITEHHEHRRQSGVMNISFDEPANTKTDEQSGNRQIYIPKQYINKKVFMEDLFNSSGDTSSRATDGTVCNELDAEMEIEDFEPNCPLNKTQCKTAPTRLPSIYKRSLSSVPYTNTYFDKPVVSQQKRGSLFNYHLTNVNGTIVPDYGKLDKLFSIHPPRQRSPRLLKRNVFLQHNYHPENDLDKTTHINQWLNAISSVKEKNNRKHVSCHRSQRISCDSLTLSKSL